MTQSVSGQNRGLGLIGKKVRMSMRFSKAWLLMAIIVLSSFVVAQESAPASGIPVSLVVTAEPRHGSTVPMIDARDVMAYLKHERAQVTAWVPLKDGRAGLQLFLLIDDASNTSLGSQL